MMIVGNRAGYSPSRQFESLYESHAEPPRAAVSLDDRKFQKVATGIRNRLPAP
jgi:hypothetical protein